MRTGIFFVNSNDKVPSCPICQNSQLKYRDSKIRIRKREGGLQEKLCIRRFKCTGCGSLHNELPSCLVPYKHYDAEVISGCIDGYVTPEDLDSEDYPCVATMLRWLRWFQLNLANIEGHLYRAFSSLGSDIQSGLSLLKAIRNTQPDWFEYIHRIIYNSGGALVPLLHFS